MNIRVESPFPFEALPRVWKWLETFRAKVSDDFSPATLDEFVSSMASKWDTQKSWAVYRDEELGGVITFERLTPWLGTAHLILKPDFQGRGIAVKACRMAVAEMFAEGVGKLVFYPLGGTTGEKGKGGNIAIGSLLVNIGAKREGKLEAHTLCGGKPTDVWMYGLTKKEFEDASSNRSSDHRRRGLNSGVDPRQAEDSSPAVEHIEHVEQLNADVHAGGPPAPAAVAGLPEFSHP